LLPSKNAGSAFSRRTCSNRIEKGGFAAGVGTNEHVKCIEILFDMAQALIIKGFQTGDHGEVLCWGLDIGT